MCACLHMCVCHYLLQHECLLLLEQGLQLGRRQDLLHLLRGDHLWTHHGHGHRHLEQHNQRKHTVNNTTQTHLEHLNNLIERQRREKKETRIRHTPVGKMKPKNEGTKNNA